MQNTCKMFKERTILIPGYDTEYISPSVNINKDLMQRLLKKLIKTY